MHAIVHIISDHKIETKGKMIGKNWCIVIPELEDIMEPYYETDFYDRYYDEEADDIDDIPPEDYPEFLWDYYTHRWTKSVRYIDNMDRKYSDPDFDWKLFGLWAGKNPQAMDARDLVGMCYTLIDKERNAVAKRHWNGQDHLDQEEKFSEAVQQILADLKPTDWITEVDVHF